MSNLQTLLTTKDNLNQEIIKELAGLPRHGDICVCEGPIRTADFIEYDEGGTRIDAFCTTCGGWLRID